MVTELNQSARTVYCDSKSWSYTLHVDEKFFNLAKVVNSNGVKSTGDTCDTVGRLLSGLRHPGTYPKKPGGFFGYTLLKNPHFYFNLILV